MYIGYTYNFVHIDMYVSFDSFLVFNEDITENICGALYVEIPIQIHYTLINLFNKKKSQTNTIKHILIKATL